MSIRFGTLSRALAIAALLVACDSAPTSPTDDAGPDATAALPDGASPPTSDASFDAGTGPFDAGSSPVEMPPTDWPESRGWSWVRSNPMFISALTVRMGEPSGSAVARYFDDFDASAIHLWETGLPNELPGWHAHRPGAPWLTWLHGDGTNVVNGRLLGGYPAGAPGRIGYQLGDEPRDWDQMEEIMSGLEAVRGADPDALRIVNFSWWADVLDGFMDRYCESGLGDVVSYDIYTRSSSHYEVLRYFRDIGLRCDMPYWRYIKGYVGTDDAIQTRADMRWAAFVGLTFGYTGHTWFLYQVLGGDAEGIPSTFFARTDDWSSPVTERFAWAAELNREMAVYGRALTQLLSTDVGWATDSPFAGLHPPQGADLFRAGMDPHLSAVDLDGRFVDALLGFFVDRNGERYVIVQNPNHDNGTFPTDDASNLRATLRFDFSGVSGVDTTHVQVLDGGSGSVRNAPLVDGGLPIDLEAGDILFFKYDTGRPFAGF